MDRIPKDVLLRSLVDYRMAMILAEADQGLGTVQRTVIITMAKAAISATTHLLDAYEHVDALTKALNEAVGEIDAK